MAIIALGGKINSGKDTVGKIIQYLNYFQETGIHPGQGRIQFIIDALTDSKKFEVHYETSITPYCKFGIKKFAGKLKEMASLFTGISVADMEKSEVKDSLLGKEWVKYRWAWINSNIWHPCTKQEYDTKKNVSAYKVEEEGMTLRWFLQNFGTEAVRNNIHQNAWVNALFADYNPIKPDKVPFNYPNWIITDMRFPNEFQAVKDRGGICVRITRPYQMPQGMDEIARPTTPIHLSEAALDKHVFDYEINNSGTIDELIKEVQKFINHFNLKSK